MRNIGILMTGILADIAPDKGTWSDLEDKLEDVGNKSAGLVQIAQDYWWIPFLICLAAGVAWWFFSGRQGNGAKGFLAKLLIVTFIIGAIFSLAAMLLGVMGVSDGGLNSVS